MSEDNWWDCPSCGEMTYILENERRCRACDWSVKIPIRAEIEERYGPIES